TSIPSRAPRSACTTTPACRPTPFPSSRRGGRRRAPRASTWPTDATWTSRSAARATACRCRRARARRCHSISPTGRNSVAGAPLQQAAQRLAELLGLAEAWIERERRFGVGDAVLDRLARRRALREREARRGGDELGLRILPVERDRLLCVRARACRERAAVAVRRGLDEIDLRALGPGIGRRRLQPQRLRHGRARRRDRARHIFAARGGRAIEPRRHVAGVDLVGAIEITARRRQRRAGIPAVLDPKLGERDL